MNSCINKIWSDKKFLLELLAMVLIIIGLFFTYFQLKQNEKLSRNTYLTGLWNDIMRESINYPQFQDETKTAVYDTYFSQKEQTQYDTYARWIGGFIEDLYYYDYDEEGLLFFEPTIETFLEIHCKWFMEHVEYYKHTKRFYERLNTLNCKLNQSLKHGTEESVAP